MSKAGKEFVKPPLTIEEQIQLLTGRGLIINNIISVKHHLRFIGYYRLSAYFLPFCVNNTQEKSHNFQENVTFEDILNIYIFDRKLRLLVLDAIERIEIAVRAVVSDTSSLKYGKNWYEDKHLFDNKFNHQKFIEKIKEDIDYHNIKNNSQNSLKKSEVFINHYYQKYTSPDLPPSWMVFQLLPFGSVSRVYKHLNDLDLKKEIARIINIPYPILDSWLHSLSYLRNISAHHGRLWNRTFTIKPKIINKCKKDVPYNDKFFAIVFMINYCLNEITMNSYWLTNLEKLIKEYPDISIEKMGFPKNWRSLSIWK
ncbi:MAG: Abi family protein [Cyanobacterium sp. T60_A2020_053]|nr:Abi family protein [Cyanobacterium sp. T60_A2020_053]